MKAVPASDPNRIIRRAAWFYVTPRLIVVGLALGALALAIVMTLTSLLLSSLGR